MNKPVLVTADNYDWNILKEGLQFQIDKFYAPKDRQMERRIRMVMDAARPQKGEMVLDAGCGPGTFAFHCAGGGLFSIGIDYSLESLKAAKTLCDRFGVSDKVRFLAANSASLPFKDGCFDKIIAADFIEHITQEEKKLFLRESFRLLRPKGRIIVFTPNGIRERIGEWYWKARHIIFNDKIPRADLHFGLTTGREFEALLRRQGFDFRRYYKDVSRPYLAYIPWLRNLLALNLLWVIRKR